MSLQIDISNQLLVDEIKQIMLQLIDDVDNINLKISLDSNKLILNDMKFDLPVKAQQLILAIDEVVKINGQISFNFSKRLLLKNNQPLINLTEIEAKLINFLAKSDNPVTKDQLVSDIWQYDQAVQTNIVASAIFKLKQKCLENEIEELIKIDKSGKYYLNKVND